MAAEVAEPADSVTEPREVVPSKNSTVPAGVPVPGEVTATVAVKVTDCPKSEGFTEDVNVVVVGAGTTVATWTAVPLLAPLVVTTAVRLPAVLRVVKLIVNVVDVALETVPTAPLLKVTVLLAAVVSNPVPLMVSVVAPSARLAVFKVMVGLTVKVTSLPVPPT